LFTNCSTTNNHKQLIVNEIKTETSKMQSIIIIFLLCLSIAIATRQQQQQPDPSLVSGKSETIDTDNMDSGHMHKIFSGDTIIYDPPTEIQQQYRNERHKIQRRQILAGDTTLHDLPTEPELQHERGDGKPKEKRQQKDDDHGQHQDDEKPQRSLKRIRKQVPNIGGQPGQTGTSQQGGLPGGGLGGTPLYPQGARRSG
jgi:hypothetical protein